MRVCAEPDGFVFPFIFGTVFLLVYVQRTATAPAEAVRRSMEKPLDWNLP
jgi:hypothetical protein